MRCIFRQFSKRNRSSAASRYLRGRAAEVPGALGAEETEEALAELADDSEDLAEASGELAGKPKVSPPPTAALYTLAIPAFVPSSEGKKRTRRSGAATRHPENAGAAPRHP